MYYILKNRRLFVVSDELIQNIIKKYLIGAQLFRAS